MTRWTSTAAIGFAVLFIASSGGAADGAWRPISGPGHDVTALAVGPMTSTVIYAGSRDGASRSTDGGRSWQRTAAWRRLSEGSAVVASLAVHPRTPRTVYLGTYDGLYKSTDAGRSWSIATEGLFAKFEIEVLALAIDSRVPTTVFAGLWGGGVHKSVDGGRTWQTMLRGVVVNELAIDSSGHRTVYAATGRGLFRSRDVGRSWLRGGWRVVHGSLGGIEELALDPLRAGRIYAASYYDVFKSVDGGRTWSEAGDFPRDHERTVADVAVDPRRRGTVYAATSAGVFRSTDAGRVWHEFNDGLGATPVTALAIAADGHTLYAGTATGVFEYPLPG